MTKLPHCMRLRRLGSGHPSSSSFLRFIAVVGSRRFFVIIRRSSSNLTTLVCPLLGKLPEISHSGTYSEKQNPRFYLRFSSLGSGSSPGRLSNKFPYQIQGFFRDIRQQIVYPTALAARSWRFQGGAKRRKPLKIHMDQPTRPSQFRAFEMTSENGLLESKLGSRGSSSTRSPIPLRCISLVPAAMEVIRPLR